MNLIRTNIICNILNLLYQIRQGKSQKWIEGQGLVPWVELEHDPSKLTTEMSRLVNNTDIEIPDPWLESPDFRIPEPPWTAYKAKSFGEEHRPYRLSPFWKSVNIINYSNYWIGLRNNIHLLGCYCTTAFKRLTPLAGCGVLTTRHILTTATSTELVLRRYGHMQTLENILGVWYDTTDENVNNSSMYISVSRIHYHPHYNKPDITNRSHPLPCVYDMAVYAATYRLLGNKGVDEPRSMMCQRGVSTTWLASSSKSWNYDLVLLVGFQFIWSINRVPSCWVKYYVRTRMIPEYNIICPKTEWGWFHCVTGQLYARLGFDSGGAMHFSDDKQNTWRADGWIGINAFSMNLRSKQIMNYFTVIDTATNMNFLYAAYMGRQKYEYLDYRFYDSQRMAPKVKPFFYVEWVYEKGEDHPNWIPAWW